MTALWAVDQLPSAESQVHVFPLYGREHDVDGGDCWCSPETEDFRPEGGSLLLVHREDN